MGNRLIDFLVAPAGASIWNALLVPESEAVQRIDPGRARSSDSRPWATCVSRPTFARRIPSLAVESLQVSDVVSLPQPSPSLVRPPVAVAIGVGFSDGAWPAGGMAADAATSHPEGR
eukprot:9950948-Alexandrium_andersonii.AAC.1